MARVYHVNYLTSVSEENKRCPSQHTHITIVELVHRLHGKTRIFLLFIHSREWLEHIHVYVLRDSEPDRAPLKEVLGGQYNYREGGRQVLRQGA